MAAGDTLLVFGALQNEAPSSDYAVPYSRNARFVLAFDDAADQAAVFTGILPRHYAGGGLTVSLVFAMDTATTGDVVWTAAIERIGTSQDLDADGFAAAQSSGAVAVAGTAGVPVVATIAFTDGAQMDSLAVGEAFRIRVVRDADNGDDDASGDAHLVVLELRETAS